MKFETLVKQTVMRLLPTKWWVKIDYRFHIGKKCNLKNPRTLNEKLCWLKVYDHDDRQSPLADKYVVRQYVAEQIGAEYLVPQYGMWRRFKDIDFNALPEQFVLKPTHTSGDIYFCEDKTILDKEILRKTVNKWMRRKYYHQGREWSYKHLKPAIIADQILAEDDGETLRDYRFMCFNGEPKYIILSQNHRDGRETTVNYYDLDWKPLPIKKYKEGKILPQPPVVFHQLVELCRTLAKPFPFVRLDFYIVGGRIYFGEFTFSPASGVGLFKQEEWDYTFGSWLELPLKRELKSSNRFRRIQGGRSVGE